MAKRYWLLKTEPDVFSFDDLVRRPKHTDSWDGIRNYQARNFMRDEMKVGDQVLIYHSRTESPSIVGAAVVSSEPYPDESALDPKSKYFDEKSKTLGESRWVMVDVTAKSKFSNPVSLSHCKSDPKLEGMALIKRGQRLSIQPVSEQHYRHILKLGVPADI